VLIVGEVHTGLLRGRGPVTNDLAQRLVDLVKGDRVLVSERPMACVRSPARPVGVDCLLTAPGPSRQVRGVGTAIQRSSITGGHVVQGSVHTTVVRGEHGARQPWSHYLARPGVIETLGRARWPDLAAALATVFTASDEILVTPYNNQAALTVLRTHLTNRGGAIEQRGAVGVYAFTGTLANATTLAGQVNHERITGCFLPGTLSPAYELAARYAAVISSEEDPARPLNTLALTGALPPPLASRLGRVEQETCLANGVTPLEVGPGERVQIVRAITTYTLDPQAIPDIAWLDLTTIRTMDYVRMSVRNRLALRFPREKLSARTPDKVRSEILDVMFKLEELEIVEEVEANKAGVIVERDSQDPNRLDARIPTDVVNGMHVLAARLDLLL